jgi:hypothetical protein
MRFCVLLIKATNAITTNTLEGQLWLSDHEIAAELQPISGYFSLRQRSMKREAINKSCS